MQIDGYPALEMIDPNDNTQARHQYLLRDRLLLRRRLPAEGDRWRDDPIDVPWWEPVIDVMPGSPIGDFLAAHGVEDLGSYRKNARYLAGHVAMYTPNGREVRFRTRGGGYEVQPRNDNYWIEVQTTAEARAAYFGAPRGAEG